MGRAIGIDLGTTFSAVAVVDDTGTPVIVPAADGRATTPSVVLFEQVAGHDRPVVGEVARRQAGSRPDDTVAYVKRYMGDPNWRFDSATDTQYRPEEISAIILRELVRSAEASLGESIRDVVITVPAYFDDSRRTATKQAGAIAGLNVLGVLNEPTAAALSFGIRADRDGTVLVYDLGGGTFDVTILGIEQRTFTVLATDGDRNLGGFDWDNALMTTVVAELESAHGVTGFLDDVDAVALLRQEAERAKRELSQRESTTVNVAHGDARYTVALSREQFETASRSLLRRTQELVEDTLDAAGLGWDDIDSVVLVGGSTRMPAVRSLVTRLSGREPVEGVDPDEAVALGAAVHALTESGQDAAAALAPITVEDVTSQALGTLALDDQDLTRNFVVIERNTKVPAVGAEALSTMSARRQLTITVTQGDDADPDFVTTIGEGVLTLEEEWPAGTDFMVVYRYDLDQIVQVEVYRLPDEVFVGTFTIDRVANLTTAQVEAAAARLSELVPAPEALGIPAPALPLTIPQTAQLTATAPLQSRR